jgi:hypothetical protein
VVKAARSLSRRVATFLDARNMVSIQPGEYHNPDEYGPDFCDRPENRGIEETRTLQAHVVIILHPATASGLGSISDIALTGHVPRVILKGTPRLSPMLAGGDPSPFVLEIDGEWQLALGAWLDAMEEELRAGSLSSEKSVQLTDGEIATIKNQLEGAPRSFLTAPWRLRLSPADFRRAMNNPVIFDRLPYGDVREIKEWAASAQSFEADSEFSNLPEIPVDVESDGDDLPKLDEGERTALSSTAKREGWPRKFTKAVERIGRRRKLARVGSRQKAVDLHTEQSWIEIASAMMT